MWKEWRSSICRMKKCSDSYINYLHPASLYSLLFFCGMDQGKLWNCLAVSNCQELTLEKRTEREFWGIGGRRQRSRLSDGPHTNFTREKCCWCFILNKTSVVIFQTNSWSFFPQKLCFSDPKHSNDQLHCKKLNVLKLKPVTIFYIFHIYNYYVMLAGISSVPGWCTEMSQQECIGEDVSKTWKSRS